MPAPDESLCWELRECQAAAAKAIALRQLGEIEKSNQLWREAATAFDASAGICDAQLPVAIADKKSWCREWRGIIQLRGVTIARAKLLRGSEESAMEDAKALLAEWAAAELEGVAV